MLNVNKPGVYISFLLAGKIEPLETGVSHKYLWFRITNNTCWAIWLEMSGVPKAYGDASLYFTIVESQGGKIRMDSRCHVCSVNPVRPGRSVVFSIPNDYPMLDTFLRLNYSFAWELENENEGGLSVLSEEDVRRIRVPLAALIGADDRFLPNVQRLSRVLPNTK